MTRQRVVAAVGAALIAATLAALTLGPLPLRELEQVTALARRGVALTGADPAAITPQRLERVLNVAVFVPVGALAAAAGGSWRWVCAAALVPLAIEGYQMLATSDRTASAADVVLNWLGIGLGAALVMLSAAALRRRAGSAAPRPSLPRQRP